MPGLSSPTRSIPFPRVRQPLAYSAFFQGEMMKIAQLLPCFLATVLAGTLPGVAARISLDDLPKVVKVTEPQISPDGKTVAIVVARANLKDDRWDAEIVLVDIATKQSRTVTQNRLGIGSPRWRPDRLCSAGCEHKATDFSAANDRWRLHPTDALQNGSEPAGVESGRQDAGLCGC